MTNQQQSRTRIPDSLEFGEQPYVMDPTPLAFRRLQTGDLPLLHRWLNAPHVIRWWGKNGPTWDEVVAKYTPRLSSVYPKKSYIILYGDAPIGFIQTEMYASPDDYTREVPEADGAAGVDLLIGEVQYVHRGLGAPLLIKFLREIVFADPTVERCVIDPEPANTAAIRAYEKAGFRLLQTAQGLAEAVPRYYLMQIIRADVQTSVGTRLHLP